MLRWLERRGTARNREGMAHFGIRPARTFGVSLATMRPLVRRLGRDHALAVALWDSGWHEARVLAAFVEDPAAVTPAQMDAWCRAFDNWAVCDTVCTHLFARTPHAWRKAEQWSRRKAEFQKRAGFAMMAGLTVQDKTSPDARFARLLPIIARAAEDDRHFVKKAVNWALRQIGKRNVTLNAAALTVAHRLAASSDAAPRWVGKDAVRELSGAAVPRAG